MSDTETTTASYWVPSDIPEAGMQPDGYQSAIPYQRHPVSKIGNSMTVSDLEELEDSILKNGLYDPIQLYQGQVIEGWHRLNVLCKHGLLDPKRHVRKATGSFESVFERAFAREVAHRHMTVTQKAQYLMEASVLRGVPAKLLPGYTPNMAGHLKSLERANRVGLIKLVKEGLVTSSEVNRICQCGLASAIVNGTIDVVEGKSLASKFQKAKPARDEFLSLVPKTEPKELEALAYEILERYEAAKRAAVEAAKEARKAAEEAQETQEAQEAQEAQAQPQSLSELQQVEQELQKVRKDLRDVHEAIQKLTIHGDRLAERETELVDKWDQLQAT